MATYWVAMQHFRTIGDRGPFWYICKVTDSRERARGFDDRDPAADSFKVVGWATDAFGDDAPAALRADYDAVRDAAEVILGKLAAIPGGQVLDTATERRGS